jgi:methionyl-tRNA formyltransferase
MRLIFMGTPEFAVPSLAALAAGHEICAVVTRPDRPRRRMRASPEPSPVKREAGRRGLAILQPESIRDAAFADQARALAPEVIVVVAFGAILPPALLAIPPLGCVNLHASLLPRLRGAAPIARSIIEGEERTGVTTMRMDEGLDTGPILMQEELAIGALETAGELTARLAAAGAPLLLTTLGRLRAGTLVPAAQDASRATLAPPLGKPDGRIDWDLPADSIARRIRGCNPWPTASARLRGATVQLLRAGTAAGTAPGGAPGEIVALDGERILVCCGAGSILAIMELRFAGRRTITAREAVNGRLVEAGESFAPAATA